MSDANFVDFMVCLGFGLGSIFWALVWFIVFGGRK